MNIAEAKFFSTQTDTAATTTASHLGLYLDGWSMKAIVYPLLKEGDCVWTDDRFTGLNIGTRAMYREWLSLEETLPNPTRGVTFYPLGLVLCVVGGKRVHSSGHTSLSNAEAGMSDFSALAHALGDGKVGKGVYTTYCKHFGVERPRYLDKEYDEEENFLQEFFASR